MIMNIELMFKRKLMRRRQQGIYLHRSKLLNAFTFVASAEQTVFYRQSLQILKVFIPKNIGLYPLILGARRTIRKFEMIQKKMRDWLAIKLSKVDVLINFWNKLVGRLYKTANDERDQNMAQLLRKIINVPEHIKKWVLTLYLYSCRELSQIAFL